MPPTPRKRLTGGQRPCHAHQAESARKVVILVRQNVDAGRWFLHWQRPSRGRRKLICIVLRGRSSTGNVALSRIAAMAFFRLVA